MIDFGAYLSSLCASFAALEEEQHRNIELTCHWEPIVLGLDTVTALGLAVAELISNSYVHAFPGGTGAISVSVRRGEPDSEATITFVDDGVGFRELADSKRHGVGLGETADWSRSAASAELLAGPGTGGL
ncbi:MAG: sensor histidine kinase [Pseudomonadota bacterium]